MRTHRVSSAKCLQHKEVSILKIPHFVVLVEGKRNVCVIISYVSPKVTQVVTELLHYKSN